MDAAAIAALLASLPRESRNIPRRSRALVIDRLRAAVEALLSADPRRPLGCPDASSADAPEGSPQDVLGNAQRGGDVARSLRGVSEQGA